MTDTSITIEFENEFRYTTGKEFEEGLGVTITAPSFKDIDVHDMMSAYAARAQLGAIGMMSKTALENIQAMREAGEGEETEGEDSIDSDTAVDYAAELSNYKIALGDDYKQYREKVVKALSKNKNLCVVTGTDHVLSKDAWEAIGEANGIKAVEDIIGGFASFFGG